MPKNIYQLFKDREIETIFSEFEAQYKRAKLHTYVEGDRKASSTAQKNHKDEMLIHLLAAEGDGRDFQRCYNFGKKEDINARTKDGLSPIHYAIKSNNIPRIIHIVNLGANILGLKGGIAGLVDYAVKPETKEFLNSDKFKNKVNIYKAKAERIIASTPEKEHKRNNMDNGKQRQRRLSGVFSSQRIGAEQQEEQRDMRALQIIAEEQGINIQPQQHLDRADMELRRFRGAFRSAATILREEEQRNELISAVTNAFESSSSLVNSSSVGSSLAVDLPRRNNIDAQESQDIQEALHRSMMPEYNQENYMRSSHSNSMSSSMRSNVFLRNFSQHSSPNIYNSTQSTLIVDSQVLGDENINTSPRSRASSEESGHTTADNISHSRSSDEGSSYLSNRSVSSRSSSNKDSDSSSEEGDRNKRRGDNDFGSPSRAKKVDNKNTPKKDKSPNVRLEANKESESFVGRLLGSRDSKENVNNDIVSGFSQLQNGLNISQTERVVFRRQQAVVRDAATSPIYF